MSYIWTEKAESRAKKLGLDERKAGSAAHFGNEILRDGPTAQEWLASGFVCPAPLRVKAIFANGDSLITNINATPDQAREYYVGKTFNIGVAEDNLQSCTNIELLDEEIKNTEDLYGKLIYICSPLHGDLQGNMERATRYCEMVARLGAVPLAPHTIFTQYLNDNIPEQRERGLRMGRELLKRCDELLICGKTVSSGMETEIALAKNMGKPIHNINEVILKMDNQALSNTALTEKARLLQEYRSVHADNLTKNMDELWEKTGLAEYQQIHPIEGNVLPYFVLDKNKDCRFAYSPFADEKFAVLVHNDYGIPILNTDHRMFGVYGNDLKYLFDPADQLNLQKIEETLLEFEPAAVLAYERYQIFSKLEHMEAETGARSFVFSGEAIPPIVSLPAEVEDYLTPGEIKLAEKLITVKASLRETTIEENQVEEVEQAEEEELEEDEVLEEDLELDLTM